MQNYAADFFKYIDPAEGDTESASLPVDPIEAASVIADQGIQQGHEDTLKKEDEGSDFTRGMKEAYQQIPQLGYGLVALAGGTAESAFGEGGLSTKLKNIGVDGYQDWQSRIQVDAKRSDSLDYSWDKAKDGDYGALVDWAQHGLGYTIGQASQLLTGTGLAKIGAQAAIKGSVEKFAAGLVAKETKKILTTEVGKKLAKDEVARLATRAAARKIGERTAIATTAFGMEGGEIGGDTVSHAAQVGHVLSGAEIARMLGATAVAGGLEYVGDKVGLDALFGKSKMFKAAEAVRGVKGRAARGALGATGVAGTESGTEYLQTGAEQYGKGQDLTADSSAVERFDAAGLGAMGGVIGGVGGVMTPVARGMAPEPAKQANQGVALDKTEPVAAPEQEQPKPTGPLSNAVFKFVGMAPRAGGVPWNQGMAPSVQVVEQLSVPTAEVDGEPTKPEPVATKQQRSVAKTLKQSPTAQVIETSLPDFDGYTLVVDGDDYMAIDTTGRRFKLTPTMVERISAAEAGTTLPHNLKENDYGGLPEVRQEAGQAEDVSPVRGKDESLDDDLRIVRDLENRAIHLVGEKPVKDLLNRLDDPKTAIAELQRMISESNGDHRSLGEAGENAAKAHEAATSPLNDVPEPTEAQKEAGNYKKGHVQMHGMDISVENPAGSVRKGVAQDGKKWETPIVHHYGYFKNTVGFDKDQLDVFLGPNAETADTAYVIDQKNKDGSFDEHKAVIGAKDKQDALDIYNSNYEPGWDGAAAITAMPMDEFKRWAKSDAPKKGALAYKEKANGKTKTNTQGKQTGTEERDGTESTAGKLREEVVSSEQDVQQDSEQKKKKPDMPQEEENLSESTPIKPKKEPVADKTEPGDTSNLIIPIDKIPSDLEVKVKVVGEKTGRKATAKYNAREAVEYHNKMLERLNKVLDCVS